MKSKLSVSVFAAMFFLIGSALSQSIQSGIVITANATGLSAVHFLPGTYEWEVYAPGKSITGKVHADIDYQVNLFPGIDYTSETSFKMVAGNPQDIVSVWFNTDENQENFEVWDPFGHLTFHEPAPQGPKGGFVVLGTFGSLKMVKGKTYYGVFTSTIFPLGAPTPTPKPTPCP